MSQERTIIYVPDLAELTEQYDLPIDDPQYEDWGLVTEGTAYVQIEFVYAKETIQIAQAVYDRLLHEYAYSKEFTPDNPTEQVLKIGSGAVLDIKHGQPPLEGIGNELPSAVATVFAMQADQGHREWPDAPNESEKVEGVPTVTVTEPVYPDIDANTPRWVTCELKWDPEREVFVNTQADPDWELDEEAASDSSYVVADEEFSNIQDAMQTALMGTEWEGVTPTNVIEPESGESPEWGPAV